MLFVPLGSIWNPPNHDSVDIYLKREKKIKDKKLEIANWTYSPPGSTNCDSRCSLKSLRFSPL